MPLSPTERQLLDEACANRYNDNARILLNLFGAQNGAQVVEQIAAAPIVVRVDLIDQVRKAIDEQRRYRMRRS